MIIPRLIHPIYIEIQFLDKQRNVYNDILQEHIGDINLTKPVILEAQKGYYKKQQIANMVGGGDSPESENYYLIYQSEWREKAGLEDDDPIRLQVFKTAVITKEEVYPVNYKIKAATPVVTYNHRTYLLRLDYEIPEKGG